MYVYIVYLLFPCNKDHLKAPFVTGQQKAIASNRTTASARKASHPIQPPSWGNNSGGMLFL